MNGNYSSCLISFWHRASFCIFGAKSLFGISRVEMAHHWVLLCRGSRISSNVCFYMFFSSLGTVGGSCVCFLSFSMISRTCQFGHFDSGIFRYFIEFLESSKFWIGCLTLQKQELSFDCRGSISRNHQMQSY